MYWQSYMFRILALMTDSIVFKSFTFVFVSAHCLNVCSEKSLLSVSHIPFYKEVGVSEKSDLLF